MQVRAQITNLQLQCKHCEEQGVNTCRQSHAHDCRNMHPTTNKGTQSFSSVAAGRSLNSFGGYIVKSGMPSKPGRATTELEQRITTKTSESTHHSMDPTNGKHAWALYALLNKYSRKGRHSRRQLEMQMSPRPKPSMKNTSEAKYLLSQVWLRLAEPTFATQPKCTWSLSWKAVPLLASAPYWGGKRKKLQRSSRAERKLWRNSGHWH